MTVLFLELPRNRRELLQRRLHVVNNLLGQHIGRRRALRVAKKAFSVRFDPIPLFALRLGHFTSSLIDA